MSWIKKTSKEVLNLYVHRKLPFQICEPFYGDWHYKMYASCVYYFIPTLVFMYCYGSIFHASKFKQNTIRDSQKHVDKELLHSPQGNEIVIKYLETKLIIL